MERSDLKKLLVKETNKNKLSYIQLKNLFKEVRHACDIVPESTGRSLYELPTTDDLKAFYCHIEDAQHRLVFKTLEQTGLRIAELCHLEVKRIDFPDNTIFIHKGKGDIDRKIPIGNKLKELLQIYLAGKRNRYLFESNRHTKYTTRRIQQICQEYVVRANINKKFTCHTFRHIYFTRLAEAQISKEYRALLAGHINDDTQDIYTHLGLGGIKKEIIDLLDGF